MKLILIFMAVSKFIHKDALDTTDYAAFRINKQIPVVIEKNVLKALSYYPELKDVRISFIFKSKIKSSVMQAQPVFTSLLKSQSKRRYRINISTYFRLTQSVMPITKIPDEVMIGWLGHELGHIIDYETRTSTGLVSFGYRYYFSPEFVKHAEIAADTYAVNHGMGNYIITTKRFILNHADLPKAYKEKISRLYLSPDIIMEQVKKLEEEKLKQQEKQTP